LFSRAVVQRLVERSGIGETTLQPEFQENAAPLFHDIAQGMDLCGALLLRKMEIHSPFKHIFQSFILHLEFPSLK
jgi:hypothetical protein